MRNTLLAYLILLLPTAIMAQTNQTYAVQGEVRDTTGEPLPFATVVIESLSLATTTDLDGNYTFKNVPTGTHNITAKMMGFKDQTKAISVKNTPLTSINFTLGADVTELDEVVIKVEKSEKKQIEESGFAVVVIDTKDASVRNLQTNELLDRAVGVRVRQNGGLGSRVEYNLNGMSGRSIGIFINGLDISTYGSSFNINNIPPAMIERIEIYKGVLPAHLSGDYLGGAINIILKGNLSGNNLTVATSYGSFNTSQTDVSGMYRHKKTGFTARATLFYNYSDNDYKIWGRFVRNTLPNGQLVEVTAKRFNDAYKTYGIRAEAGFTKVKWADELMFSFNKSYAYNEIQHGQYMTKPYMGRFTESNANVIGLNYRKKNFLAKGLNFTFNGVYSDRVQYVEDTVSWNYNWYGEKMIGINGTPIKTSTGAQQGAPTMMTINRKIGTIRSSLSYNITQNHRITLNHLYYVVDRDDLDEILHVSDRIYTSTSDLSKNVTSLSYESHLLKNRLKTNLFAKHYNQNTKRISPYADDATGEYMEDHITDSRGTWGYGLAISYKLLPKVMLISSAEKAVRMPHEQEIFGGPAENIVANTGLNPEISNNLNLGLRLGNFYVKDHRFLIAGTFFVRNVQDKIQLQASDRLVAENTQTLPYANLGRAQAIGFESEISYHYKEKFNAGVAVSKFNDLFKLQYDENGKELDFYNKQIPNEPFFTINFNAQYRLSDLFQKKSVMSINYYLGYIHPFNTIWIDPEKTLDPGHSITPAQYIQDLGLSYRFPGQKLTVSFDIKNIFNRQLFDNFAVQKPGRGFYLKINYTLSRLK